MAKNTQTKTIFKRFFAGALAVIFMGGITAGICSLGFASRDNNDKWFGNFKNISSWHWADKTDNDGQQPDDGNNPPDTDEGHKHTYDLTQWGFNDTYHYHKSTCEHLVVTDVAEHTYANGVCRVCGHKYDGKTADMLITGGEEHGISLMSMFIDKSDYVANGVSAYADTAYTLTATVYDEQHTTNGMPQLVEAVADFENPASEWASGKNVSDYITLNRVADNSFNVVCRQAFGEPIIITVTAVNSDKSAVKRCDYVKRVVDVDVFSSEGGSSGLVVDMPTSVSRNETTYGIGTLQGEVIFDTIVFLMERDFIDKLMQTSYYKYFAKQCEEAGFEVDMGYEVEKHLNIRQDSFQFQFDLADFLLSNMDVETVSGISNTVGLDYFKYAVIETAKSGSAVRYYINYSYNYNGVPYSLGKFESGPPWCFNVSCLGSLPPVGSVEVGGSGGGIIF